VKVIELKRNMDVLFAQVHDRFGQVDVRFAQVDARFAEVDARFAQIDERFAQVDARFAQVDARFVQIDDRFVEIQTLVTEEAQSTRRHMDVVVENAVAQIRAIATSAGVAHHRLDVNQSEHATFTGVLDDHELRLKALEHYRRR
jgi:hypothetical protein